MHPRCDKVMVCCWLYLLYCRCQDRQRRDHWRQQLCDARRLRGGRGLHWRRVTGDEGGGGATRHLLVWRASCASCQGRTHNVLSRLCFKICFCTSTSLGTSDQMPCPSCCRSNCMLLYPEALTLGTSCLSQTQCVQTGFALSLGSARAHQQPLSTLCGSARLYLSWPMMDRHQPSI